MAFENGYNLFNYVIETFNRYAEDQTIFIKACQYINSFGSDENVIKNFDKINAYLNSLLSYNFWSIYRPGGYIQMYEEEKTKFKFSMENPHNKKEYQSPDLYWDAKTVLKHYLCVARDGFPDDESMYRNLEDTYSIEFINSFIAEITAFTMSYSDLAYQATSSQGNPKSLFKVSYVDNPARGFTIHRNDGMNLYIDCNSNFEKENVTRMLNDVIDTLKDGIKYE